MSESIPAYLSAALQILAWLWFVRSSCVTVSKYPQKRAFYVILGALISVWFWAGPITLVVANFVLDNWIRAEVVWGVDCASMLYGFFIFLVCSIQAYKSHHLITPKQF